MEDEDKDDDEEDEEGSTPSPPPTNDLSGELGQNDIKLSKALEPQKLTPKSIQIRVLGEIDPTPPPTNNSSGELGQNVEDADDSFHVICQSSTL